MPCDEPPLTLHPIYELPCNDNRTACTDNADVRTLHRLCFYEHSHMLDNPCAVFFY
ncbi:hypothetical protein Barb4_02086 [Bacteroidales bacterium Barb4]|nr:hypothetical protein Barb4_02086 [Bacteroidales bacterium Barb4]